MSAIAPPEQPRMSPPPPPPRLHTEIRLPTNPQRLLALAVAGAVALDIGLRGGVTNLFVVVGLAAASAVVATEARPAAARWCAAAAVVPASFLAVWSSSWLAGMNLAAAGALLAAGTLHGQAGSIFDVTLRSTLAKGFAAVGKSLRALMPLTRRLPRPSSELVSSLLRGTEALAIVVPILIVLIALLARADAVFAGLVLPDIGVAPLVGHVLLVLVFGLALLLGGLGVGPTVEQRPEGGRHGSGQTLVVLGALAVVLTLFVVSQLVALTGAGERLIADAGLTPADYARSGFFELCWACGVILGYLGLARAMAAPGVYERRSVRLMAGTVPLLAIGLAVVSFRRMLLYDAAFGLTMLRLYVIAAIIWIAATLAMVALRAFGLRQDRGWVPAASAAAALSLALVGNVMNPEAFIVRHNVDRLEHGATVDTGYLSRLSPDAVHAIAAAASSVRDPELRDRLVAALPCHAKRQGVAALNLARATAASALTASCPADPTARR